MLLWKRGFYFDGDKGTGGGAPDPAKPDPAPGGDADPGGEPGGTGGSGGTGTFTQADVDRIVGDRVKRAGKTAVADLLKALGFEKQEDLKTLVDKQKAAADAEKSELDKAKQKALEEEQKRQTAEQQLQRERVDRLIEREATSLGFADVTDAVALVDRAQIAEEEGKVTGVKEALTALLTAKPHLKKQGTTDPNPAPGGGVPASPAGGKQPPAKSPTEEEKRKKAASVRTYW
jgi:DNA-directed RNA polymerase beta subunit